MPAADQQAERGPLPLCVAADSRSRRMARAANADKPEPALARAPSPASGVAPGLDLFVNGFGLVLDRAERRFARRT
jgi:hypothetical protein